MDPAEMVKALDHIADAWPAKIALSLLFSVAFHVSLFAMFAVLVLLDLATRWLAISHKMLQEAGAPSSLADSLHGIPEAHRRRLINSETMRKLFTSKMIMYFVLVLGAAIVDRVIIDVGRDAAAVSIVVYYLCFTELLSMIENLDEAGVSALHDLIQIVKGKRGK